MLPGNTFGKFNQEKEMSYVISTEIKKVYVKLVVSGNQSFENNAEYHEVIASLLNIIADTTTPAKTRVAF